MNKHFFAWGGGKDAPMVITDAEGRETFIPFDDAITVTGQIAKHMDESHSQTLRRFAKGEQLCVESGASRLLEALEDDGFLELGPG